MTEIVQASAVELPYWKIKHPGKISITKELAFHYL